MSAQIAADLRAATDVLKRDGWTQGAYHAPDGCHCAEGAIAVAIGQHVRADDIPDDDFTYLDEGWLALSEAALWERRLAVERTVQGHVGDGSVIHWNDDPRRTADEVITALRAAADRAEADAR